MTTTEAYESHEYDGLVIGAGGAGLRAAIEAHQAGVRSEHKHDRLIDVRFGNEAVDFRGFDGSHLLVIAPPPSAKRSHQVPAAKCEASRFRIFSAISLAARSSASRSPRSPANRCSWPGML